MAHNGQHLSGGYPTVSVTYTQGGSLPQPQSYPGEPQPYSVYPPSQQPPFWSQGQGYSFKPTQHPSMVGSAALAPLGGNSGTSFSPQQPSLLIATGVIKEEIQLPVPPIEITDMHAYSSTFPTEGKILCSIDENQKQVHYKYLGVLNNNVVSKTVALRDLWYFFSVPKPTDSDFLSKLQERVYQEIKLPWTPQVEGSNNESYKNSKPTQGQVLYTEENGKQSIHCKYWAVKDGAPTLVEKEYSYASLKFHHQTSRQHVDELKACIADRISKEAVLMFDLAQYKQTITAELNTSRPDSNKRHKASAVEKLLASLKGVEYQPFTKEEETAIQNGVFSRSRELLDRAKALYPELEGMLKPKASEFSHFLDAQNESTDGYAAALGELQAGEKQSHWIWYIFPQIKGLASNPSAQSTKYAIQDLQQACRYLQDPRLFKRYSALLEIVRQKLEQGKHLEDLFNGHIDSKKFISSITLFQLALETLLEQPNLPNRSGYESLLQDINATFSKTTSQRYLPCERTKSLCALQQAPLSSTSFFGRSSSHTSVPAPSASDSASATYQR